MSGRPLPFAMVLRGTTTPPPGVAPPGPVRDRQAERRRALATATKKAADDLEPSRKYAMTTWSRGAASDGYVELARSTPLPIVLMSASNTVVPHSTRQRRLAIASVGIIIIIIIITRPIQADV